MHSLRRCARVAYLGSAAVLVAAAAMPGRRLSRKQRREAQQQAPAPEATTAANDEGQDTATGDIVVTARRTEERLQRVPSSVSAFNERALDRIQATDTTGLQGAVPNLNIVQGRGSSNATNMFIRGIGQPDALQTFDPAVGVYVDGVYYSRIHGKRSTCSTSSGSRCCADRRARSTARTRSAARSSSSPASRARNSARAATIAVGNYDQLELELDASGPISDTVAIGRGPPFQARRLSSRIAVLDRDYNDKNTTAARGAIALTPSATVRVDVSADYSQDDAHADRRPADQLADLPVRRRRCSRCTQSRSRSTTTSRAGPRRPCRIRPS